jgi:hypothetical protein
MTTQKYTYEQLVEKIVRAKVKLEDSSQSHRVSCPVEDPESYAPCNCGASPVNFRIQAALKDLEL